MKTKKSTAPGEYSIETPETIKYLLYLHNRIFEGIIPNIYSNSSVFKRRENQKEARSKRPVTYQAYSAR